MRRNFKADGSTDEVLEVARKETDYLEESGGWRLVGGLVQFEVTPSTDVAVAFRSLEREGDGILAGCTYLLSEFKEKAMAT